MNHIPKAHLLMALAYLHVLTVVNSASVSVDIQSVCFHVFPVDTGGLGRVVAILFEEPPNSSTVAENSLMSLSALDRGSPHSC